MNVLCDQMLGSLATWLRLCGIDTYFARESLSDDDLLQIAAEQQRLLVSRDKQLIHRAQKRKIPAVLISTTSLQDQLLQMHHHISFPKDTPLSRCCICNTPLITVNRELAKQNVPPLVAETRKKFWYCPHCTKYYWHGTHTDNIIKTIENLRSTNREKD
ncbi:MAG: Mut7-C RNAse domain-containing protein [Candidatus Thermoplasmatota archaeon]|nr:Mut7-C RNAse domain-containing protein [Candidatus Thermoplasmatota archaeon]MBU1941924.1 Mut7-C RNAse domain-containing protein [Candidatus Thermoplasmatota archaeon]